MKLQQLFFRRGGGESTVIDNGTIGENRAAMDQIFLSIYTGFP
jgi:hypothetical protein